MSSRRADTALSSPRFVSGSFFADPLFSTTSVASFSGSFPVRFFGTFFIINKLASFVLASFPVRFFTRSFVCSNFPGSFFKKEFFCSSKFPVLSCCESNKLSGNSLLQIICEADGAGIVVSIVFFLVAGGAGEIAAKSYLTRLHEAGPEVKIFLPWLSLHFHRCSVRPLTLRVLPGIPVKSPGAIRRTLITKAGCATFIF